MVYVIVIIEYILWVSLYSVTSAWSVIIVTIIRINTVFSGALHTIWILIGILVNKLFTHNEQCPQSVIIASEPTLWVGGGCGLPHSVWPPLSVNHFFWVDTRIGDFNVGFGSHFSGRLFFLGSINKAPTSRSVSIQICHTFSITGIA